MSETSQQQVFTELAFYLWRVRLETEDDWWQEILVNGSEQALSVFRDAIQSMREDFKKNGQSTRKFLCNPPEDIDVCRFARENEAEIEWQIWLILRMEPEVPDDSTYEVKNKAVTLRLNDKMAIELLDVLDRHMDSTALIEEGRSAPGGLLFAADWLGIE